MRVVVITGTAAHHRNLCAAIASEFELAGVIHPIEPTKQSGSGWRIFFKRWRANGPSVMTLYLLGKLVRMPDRSSILSDITPSWSSPYEEIPEALIHRDCNVRASETWELLESLKPDVTVCLGGPVYPNELIRKSPLMLNFHSGLSPLYNGTGSIRFAFANGHPHLCGGTLMTMNTKVDGGRILGHYLPAIQSGDTPVTLFHKTVSGAIGMFCTVLHRLATDAKPLFQVTQVPPLFYTRAVDFGWYHAVMINKHVRNDLPARFVRRETALHYWRAESDHAARNLYESTINQLILHPSHSA